MTTQLSKNFSLAELTVTETGLPNVPAPLEVAELRRTAARMEVVRALLGDRAIHVDSAFRSERVNATVGGVPNSAHRLGYAVDFTCATFGPPLDVCRALLKAHAKGKLAFDQLIFEGTWVHISFDQRNRGEVLTKTASGYESGLPR